MNSFGTLDEIRVTAPAVDERRPAILPAAIAADRMADCLEASFKRTGHLDVVARANIEGALRALDRMFALETYRFAYFHEDPLDFEEYVEIGSELSDEQSSAIAKLFSEAGVSVISSFLNMDDLALAESLEFGLSAIDWQGEGRSTRELLIDETGGSLPVAYLTHAFRRASSRLQGILENRAGLTRSQAKIATLEIRRSVAIETVRAGCIAGERLETLASWVLTLEQVDASFVTRLLTRGANLFLMALLAAASGIPETDIRESVWNKEEGGLHAACARLGMDEQMADFVRDALIQSREIGRVATAEDLARFCFEMARWIEDCAEDETAPEPVVEAAMALSDWQDWHPRIAAPEIIRSADIIAFPKRI